MTGHSNSPSSTVEPISRTATVLLAVLTVIRFALSLFIGLVVATIANSDRHHWRNIGLTVLFVSLVLWLTHLIERRHASRPAMFRRAAWFSYITGVIVGALIFVFDRTVDWFGHFTGS